MLNGIESTQSSFSERTDDHRMPAEQILEYVIQEELNFEVGGKAKNRRQIGSEKNAYILADDLIVGSKDVIPLYLFGLLY